MHVLLQENPVRGAAFTSLNVSKNCSAYGLTKRLFWNNRFSLFVSLRIILHNDFWRRWGYTLITHFLSIFSAHWKILFKSRLLAPKCSSTLVVKMADQDRSKTKPWHASGQRRKILCSWVNNGKSYNKLEISGGNTGSKGQKRRMV